MPRQWQYPARADVYPPPAAAQAAPPSGWEPVAPVTAFRRKADPGSSWDVLFGLNFGGFTMVFPVTGTYHRPTDRGWTTEIFRALPQPTAPGMGFESVAPDRARLRAPTPAWIDPPLTPPAPPPVLNPWSYQAESPDRALRRSPAQAFQDSPLSPPPLPPVLSPWAYMAEAPDRARLKPAPAVFQDSPLSPVVYPNLGWVAVYPEVKGRRPTDAGGYADTFRALPQPLAPNGWDVIAPERSSRTPRAPGTFAWAADVPTVGSAPAFPACPTFDHRPDEACSFPARPPRCPDES